MQRLYASILHLSTIAGGLQQLVKLLQQLLLAIFTHPPLDSCHPNLEKDVYGYR